MASNKIQIFSETVEKCLQTLYSMNQRLGIAATDTQVIEQDPSTAFSDY